MENQTIEISLMKYPTDEDWALAKECTLVTVGKNMVTPPSLQWKKDILEARHSPIRELKFMFKFINIPYYVSVHLCRHVHAQPYVKSQRNDRQSDYDRTKAPQDAPVNMIWSMNAEELLTIFNKRLCKQTAEETRAVVKQMAELVKECCPEFADEIVPMCGRNGGVCHEMFPCNKG